jgi:AraC family transcriptional activator of tynA and feaB
MHTGLASQTRYWSTASAEAGRAFNYWIDTVCSELVELQIKSSGAERFQAWMLQKPVGPVSLNFIYTRETQNAWRTQEGINRTREPRFDLVYVRNGLCKFEHYGRSFAVSSDECVLIDSSQTYYFESSESATCTSVQIPQRWLRSWIAAPEDCIANVVTTRTPWGRALLATLAALTPDSLENLVIPAEVVPEQLAALLSQAVGTPATQMNRSQRKLLPRIRQSLRAQAHDQLLSPARLAKDHAISKRHLHALFAATGTTFSRELMNVRLDRAHAQLSDPRFATVSVSEIAWQCGFSDSSHFARRFHQRYGVAPRAYRRTVLPQAAEKLEET